MRSNSISSVSSVLCPLGAAPDDDVTCSFECGRQVAEQALDDRAARGKHRIALCVVFGPVAVDCGDVTFDEELCYRIDDKVAGLRVGMGAKVAAQSASATSMDFIGLFSFQGAVCRDC